jgi:predicted DNA-binding transcriptional regulator AlpA
MTAQAPAALTVPLAEAARLLGMSESNARLLEKQGKFPVKVSRVGSWLRVSRAEIDAYLHVAPAPAPASDFGAVLIRARLAAIEAERAVLTSYLGEAGPVPFSRTAGPSRINAAGGSAAYPPADAAGGTT